VKKTAEMKQKKTEERSADRKGKSGTVSGGDFVCHILQKMKNVWLTLFLFEMIL
jgi:hypothetical protein